MRDVTAGAVRPPTGEPAVTMPFDLDTLLAPIEGDVAAGVDPREGGPGSDVYLRLKDLRATARLAERDAAQGEAETDPLRAGVREWDELGASAAELLRTSAKDLEVAAWMTEALLRTAGIQGLADGFATMAGLIERYWDDGLYPAADEDGDETRMAPLFGLFGQGGTGTLLQPLKLVALSDYGDAVVTLYTAEVASATPPPRLADEDAQALVDERRQAALEAVRVGIGRSSTGFLTALRTAFVRAIAALDALMSVIDRVSDFGRFGSQVGEPLAGALRLIDDHAPVAAANAAARSEEADAPGAVADGAKPGARGPTTRQDALVAVLALADFFDASEPQSPVGPALRDVVRRARLPLDALLLELLPDTAQRTLFLQRAGIRVAGPAVDNDY